MFVDFRWDEETSRAMVRALHHSRMSLVSTEDLTSMVVASPNEYASRRRASLEAIIPGPLLEQALNDSAVSGSARYQAFVNRWTIYQRSLLRSPA
jgi:hypothetical protein